MPHCICLIQTIFLIIPFVDLANECRQLPRVDMEMWNLSYMSGKMNVDNVDSLSNLFPHSKTFKLYLQKGT